jgi:TonB family protein
MIALIAADQGAQRRQPIPAPPPIQTRPAPSPPPVIVAPPALWNPPPPALPPTPPRHIGGTITNDDYPASAILAGAEGEVRTMSRVGVNGRVESCSVEISSGNSALDLTSCSLIQRRFRYQPATRNGEPVPSIVRRRVLWHLPADEVIQYGAGQLVWTQRAVDGVVNECEFTPAGPAFSGMERRCGSNWVYLINPDQLPAGPRLSVSNILVLIPEGGTAMPLPRADRPDFATSATLEIGPRGQILQCQVTERSGEIARYVRPLLTDICVNVRQEKKLGFPFHPADPRPVRRATLRQLIYVDP